MQDTNVNLQEMYKTGTSTPTGVSEADAAMEKAIQESLQKQSEIQQSMQPEPANIGGGVIIQTPQEQEKGIKVGAMRSDVLSNVEETMNSLNAEIEEAKKMAELKRAEMEAKAQAQAEEVAEDEEDAFDQEKYDKAIVIINKSGMGTVQFSDEERAKMEKVKKIEVQEVEVLSLETLKIKREKKSNIDKVLKAKKNVGGTSNIVLVASGYTAVMGKCSLFELSNLFIDKQNLVETQLSKWSFIYSKIVSSSINFSSFDDFIKSTAISDYSSFIFGILCASYPDVDEIGLTCRDAECPGKITKNRQGKETKVTDYEFKYDIRSMIRAERMSEELLEKIKNIVDNSYVEETALASHKEAPVSVVKRYRLPNSGYIIDAGIESVHDFIYNAARVSDTLDDEKYRQSLTTATIIRSLYIPDEDGEFYQFTDKLDIAKALYELYDERDIKAVIKQNTQLTQDLTIEYGFANVVCPYCKHVTPFIPVDPDDVLFHKYRQATMTE